MITLGIGLYILSTIVKFMSLKSTYDNVFELTLSSARLNFQKNNPEAILSFPQLIALISIGIGLIELAFQNYLSNLPSLLTTVLEAFFFLATLAIITQLIKKQ